MHTHDRKWRVIPYLIILVLLPAAGPPLCRQNRTSSITSATTTGGATAVSYAVTLPTIPTKAYGSHEAATFSASFTMESGATATCSHDGGANYSSCNTASSIHWTGSEYTNNSTLKIKFTHGSAVSVYDYPLQSSHPGLQFFTCTQTVTADEDFDAFRTRINGNGEVICINSGVTILNTAQAYFSTIGANVVIIGTTTSKPLIKNVRNTGGFFDGSIFFINGDFDPRFYNLRVETTGSNGFPFPFTFGIGGSGADPDTVVLQDVDVTTTGNGANAIYISGGVIDLSIINSTITTGPSAHAFRNDDSDWMNSVTITGSTLTSTSIPTFVTIGGTTTFTDSTINYSGGWMAALDLWNGSPIVTLNHSTVMSNTYAVEFSCGTGPCTLNLNGSTIKRQAYGPSNAAISMINAGTGIYINSTTKGNLFCDEDDTISRFTEIIETGGSNTANLGTFNPSSAGELNGGNFDANISNCP